MPRYREKGKFLAALQVRLADLGCLHTARNRAHLED